MDNTRELIKFQEYLSGRVQPGTVGIYMNALRTWFATANGNVDNPETAQLYVDSLARTGLAPSTVATRAHAIMRYMRWKGQDVRLDCPTIRMGRPKYLLMKQIEELIAACVTQLERTLIVVLFDSALRISELLNLKVSEIDWNNGILTIVGKGGRTEEVNVSGKALKELKRWLSVRKSKSKQVFVDLPYSTAWVIIKRIGQRVNIELHPHLLRHSRAIQMRRAGAALEDIKDHLRHKNNQTTANIYAGFTAADLKEKIPPW